jgi:ATP-dependent Lhr-like helicase
MQSRLVDGDAASLVAELRDARRTIEVAIAGETRWAAVEDAGRLRDALGAAIPLGVAEAYLAPVKDPLADLVSRHARTHGPFTTAEAATRFGLGTAVVGDVLKRLARDGRLTEGEFRPQTTGAEWVEPGVLRRLRSRSLAAARQQVEPVEPVAMARFLPAWQGVGSQTRGAEGVLSAIDQLAGVALPASAWESLVLPARVVDYSPAMLDELLAAGDVVWTGAGSLPGRDGWIQLHPADLVLPAQRDVVEPDELGAQLLEALDGGGAFLFRQIAGVVDEPDTSLLTEALWQLVWDGRVAGDSFAPVRARLSRSSRARIRGRAVRATPPTVSGRWFRIEPTHADPTRRQLARTEALLARYGVVTRGSVVAEQTPGGFSASYRVLRELEQTGACLRGYYVDTLGAAQFAAPATVDRLRSFQRDPADEVDAVVLAATDPANPFGAALPWPEVHDAEGSSRHRPARKAGAVVVLHDGRAVLFVERGGRTVLVLDDDPDRLGPAARALAAAVRTRRIDRLTIESAGGRPVASTDLGAALREAGFDLHPKGLRLDARR